MTYRVLSTTVSLVLLAAAVGKLAGQSVSPLAQTGLLRHPGVTMAVVEWEILLGAALLARFRPRLVRYLTLGTFAAFAAASGYAVWTGSSSCGCFGVVDLNPWYVFLFDLAVLAAFAAVRPPAAPAGAGLPGFLRPVAGGAVLALLVLGGLTLVYHDPATALARLRGQSVVVSPAVLDLGTNPGGTEVVRTVQVTNLTDAPVRIVGGSSDCSCILTEGLPLTLAPRASADLPVRVKLPKDTGAFHRSAFVWTDAAARELRFEITGVMAE
ncbi:MAG TPA: MauE/DoxX family redox-associated membrane protein [Gemmataceae bacterium]|nr:MauE/DoxX family redox-associated membrane protein [Gemmataceae bacterium]